jgi:hypothetical protein
MTMMGTVGTPGHMLVVVSPTALSKSGRIGEAAALLKSLNCLTLT